MTTEKDRGMQRPLVEVDLEKLMNAFLDLLIRLQEWKRILRIKQQGDMLLGTSGEEAKEATNMASHMNDSQRASE
jgi:hypothetical protein